MDILAEISSLGLLGTGLSQHARLFTLTSAQESGLPESLMAEHFSGHEAVNELFAFDIDALSTSANLDLNQFIGEELTISLLQPDGSRRAWHGLCVQAGWRGADGGVARYRLRLEPALTLLSHRRDSYIFQDKNVQEIITELLSDYPQIRFDFELTQELAPRALVTQYRESDRQFVTRLLASEGLNWRFEHDQPGADDDGQGDGHSRHRLVIFDSRAAAPDTPGQPVRFHGVRATEKDDAIDVFRARRAVQANAVSISSWDPDQLIAPAAQQQSALQAGALPELAIYDGSGERIASESAQADLHSQLMLQALEMDNKTFEGEGAVRRLAAGHAFELTQHERLGEGETRFKVLSVSHRARNNFGTQIKVADAGIAPGTYRNAFACVRESVAVVPRAILAPAAATAMGPQTALVVGMQDAVATTTRDHRIKVQFAWQRGQNPNPGGAAHDVDASGSAPGDDTAGTWVRVSEALAGPNWGSQFTPRIGTEVLVDFIEGDIDRPVVVAQLYTGSDLPPFAAGEDSGANHAGALSGIHSHGFDGAGFNQWQLDDTTGQVRTRLASSTAATELNLGYLIAQPPGSAQRGAYRGRGFELRTDAWGVVRGGNGVLLSTTARPQLGSGVTSTQMDVAEAVTLLKGAQELAVSLTEAATHQKALSSAAAAKAQTDLISQLDPGAKGKYSDAVNGHDARKAASGGRDLEQPVEKFGAPVVLMESPSSVNWATPASSVLYAGEQLQWTTQSDLHLSAAHTVASVAANATSLFAQEGGIQAIAGNGPVSLQAHTDQLEILADKDITVVSVNDSIEIKAQQKIVLQAGQSSITLEGGDITFACPGNFTVKGGQHPFVGGAAAAAKLPPLPDGRLKLFDEAFIVKDPDGQPVAGMAYRIKLPDGTFQSGVTDELGRTHIVQGADPQKLEIYVD